MKKIVLFLAVMCLALLSAAAAGAGDIFQDYDKVIFINQPRQIKEFVWQRTSLPVWCVRFAA